METVTAVCSCKEFSEQNLIIAIKQERLAFLEDWGFLAWLGIIVMVILTGGFWLFVMLGWRGSDILQPKYMCNQCRALIQPEQFRIPGHSNQQNPEKKTHIEAEPSKFETSCTAQPSYLTKVC